MQLGVRHPSCKPIAASAEHAVDTADSTDGGIADENADQQAESLAASRPRQASVCALQSDSAPVTFGPMAGGCLLSASIDCSVQSADYSAVSGGQTN
jgi:hypothetical protein